MRRTSRFTSRLRIRPSPSTSICAIMMRRSSVIVPRGSMRSSARKKEIRACRSTRRIAFIARPVTSRIRPRISTGSFQKAGEAPIIRTCSARFALVPLLLLTGAAAAAEPSSPKQVDVGAYVFARVAHSMGEADKAVQSYQAALASDPGNAIVAQGAFDQALAAGDQQLALNA